MSFGFYQQEESNNNQIRWITRWIVDIIVVIVLAMFLGRYLGENFIQTGHSMEPSFASGDTFLIDKISYHLRQPKRFDVIVFNKETDDNQVYMKRVIGLPGETLQVIDGQIYINNQKIELQQGTNITLPGLAGKPITLEENEYFVLGDNTDSSEDSRFADVGNIKKSQIIGRIWFQLKPFESMGLIKWEEN